MTTVRAGHLKLVVNHIQKANGHWNQGLLQSACPTSAWALEICIWMGAV